MERKAEKCPEPKALRSSGEDRPGQKHSDCGTGPNTQWAVTLLLTPRRGVRLWGGGEGPSLVGNQTHKPAVTSGVLLP